MHTRQADLAKTTRTQAAPAAAGARRAPNAAREVLELQRRIGNRAVGLLLQARGALDTPGDAHEQEADRLAAQALPLPAAARAGNAAGQPLDAALRRHFEARYGHDYGGVRLHASAEAARASAALGARAFTHERDIYFGAGQLDLAGRSGQRLLAHELVHVMQQGRPGGPRGRLQRETGWSLAPAQAEPQPGATPEQLYTYRDLYDLQQRWEDAAITAARALVRDRGAQARLIGTLRGRRLTARQTAPATPLHDRLHMGNLADPATLPHANADVQQRIAKVVTNRYQFELAGLIHQEVLREAQHGGPAMSRAEVMDHVKNAYVASLNDATRWDTIRRRVALTGGSVVNTLTPVNAEYDATAFGRYANTGWASMARNLPLDAGHDRTTNLWHSRLEGSDGAPVFEAFRSGSLGARGVGSADQQQAYSKEKAHGLLQAAAIERLRREHPQRLARADELRRKPEVEPLRVDLVSISLQTRSPGQVAWKHIGPFDEKTDVELQREALEAWNGRYETYAGLQGLPPRTVQYHVIFFATGVNAAADLLGHKQDEINDAGLQRLEQAYAAWSRAMDRQIRHDLDPANVRALNAKLAMAGQLRQDIRAELHWTPGYKDYRLPAMIANLAYLMGHAVQYNCKSGKDRTSVMDIESKAMALRIRGWIDRVDAPAIAPRVPDVYGHGSPEHKHDYRALLVEAGNLELQKLNTGSKGYKIIPKPIAEKKVAERIGKVADLVLGLTRTVEVKTRYRDEDFE